MDKMISSKLFFLLVSCVLAGCGPHFTTADLSQGMTQKEVIQKLGKPVSAPLSNGERYLIFKINDDAFGRSDNFYAIGFKDDRLVTIAPLPESMQEEKGSLIDKYIKSGAAFR